MKIVKNWLKLKSVQDIYIFLKFANFYRYLIKSFSRITRLLIFIFIINLIIILIFLMKFNDIMNKNRDDCRVENDKIKSLSTFFISKKNKDNYRVENNKIKSLPTFFISKKIFEANYLIFDVQKVFYLLLNIFI